METLWEASHLKWRTDQETFPKDIARAEFWMMHRIWSSHGREISSFNGDTSVAKCMEAKDILMLLGNPKELGYRTECWDDDRKAEQRTVQRGPWERSFSFWTLEGVRHYPKVVGRAMTQRGLHSRVAILAVGWKKKKRCGETGLENGRSVWRLWRQSSKKWWGWLWRHFRKNYQECIEKWQPYQGMCRAPPEECFKESGTHLEVCTGIFACVARTIFQTIVLK